MISTKELRIGNIISLRGNLREVTGVRSNIIFSKPFGGEDKGFYDMSDCYEAVELTREILEKVGFERIEDDIFDLSFYSLGEVLINEDLTFTLTGQAMPPLTYLHELQNLYHSLTRDELNILCLQANLN